MNVLIGAVQVGTRELPELRQRDRSLSTVPRTRDGDSDQRTPSRSREALCSHAPKTCSAQGSRAVAAIGSPEHNHRRLRQGERYHDQASCTRMNLRSSSSRCGRPPSSRDWRHYDRGRRPRTLRPRPGATASHSEADEIRRVHSVQSTDHLDRPIRTSGQNRTTSWYRGRGRSWQSRCRERDCGRPR